ncbi:alpha/beta hydrolase [Thalassoglobus polymorphus]|uniref:Acetylxylan esterase n=1 Tax=Thalassoglobus polymorphus TaxID=2527994 RepID=A0A517QSW7_9PLAN|nr:alpha/beta hydrolase [Thalassoglobus polymorphus]QDT34736.1 Acetylxylan esterase precursor [Thalassoglobus polymorphus]
MTRTLALVLLLFSVGRQSVSADDVSETYFLWPDAAAGASTSEIGRILPARENEDPPAIRITDIEYPFIKRFDPDSSQKNGTSVLILPGGGYSYDVVGKEGAEVAEWFNSMGVTAFVLYYRSPTRKLKQDWLMPVQDAQRAVRWIRSHAKEWGLDPQRVGSIGFSAGGNAVAIASTKMDVESRFEKRDEIDKASARPDFIMLIYPWKLLNADESGLRAEVVVDKQTSPTFLIHAHNDGVTSLSSVEYYKAMKQLGLPAELHIFESGGHGYGLRKVEGANVHTWPEKAEAWMRGRGLLKK